MASNLARDTAQRETHKPRIDSPVARARGIDDNRRVLGTHREETLREAFIYSSVARARERRFTLGIHPKVPEVLSRVRLSHPNSRSSARTRSLAFVSDVPVDVYDTARALTARPFRRDRAADAARGA